MHNIYALQMCAQRQVDTRVFGKCATECAMIQRLLSMEYHAGAALCCCAGHSLGGFTAISSAILCRQIAACVAFESPGLTTFYHKLAEERGDAAFWQGRVVNYLAIPNPINMCQRHLGRIYRRVPLALGQVTCASDGLLATCSS